MNGPTSNLTPRTAGALQLLARRLRVVRAADGLAG